jgi:hypothetical protein
MLLHTGSYSDCNLITELSHAYLLICTTVLDGISVVAVRLAPPGD